MSSTPLRSRRFRAKHGVDLAVRRLGESDPRELGRFLEGLTGATRAFFLPHASDAATLARMVERDRLGMDRAFLLIAEAGVAGYFFLWEFNRPVPLLGLGLADVWQGRGLGGQMLRHLVDEARDAGCAGVELTTVPTNARALRLYQRGGFIGLGEVRNVAGDGRVVLEHRMFRPLQPGARPPERQFGPPA